MKLNLKSINAERISLDALIDIPVNILNKMLDLYPKKKFGKKTIFILFGETYVVKKKRHYFAAFVVREDIKKSETHINIICGTEADPMLKPAKDARPISDLMEILALIDFDVNFDVIATFEYSDNAYETSGIDLPIRFETSGSFDEIRGVRVTKLENENVSYTAIIDRPDNKDISHSIRFNYKTRLTGDFLNLALDYSKNISGRFVRGKKRI